MQAAEEQQLKTKMSKAMMMMKKKSLEMRKLKRKRAHHRTQFRKTQNERLAEALHQSKEEISGIRKDEIEEDKAETEADEQKNAIVAGEEKTRN